MVKENSMKARASGTGWVEGVCMRVHLPMQGSFCARTTVRCRMRVSMASVAGSWGDKWLGSATNRQADMEGARTAYCWPAEALSCRVYRTAGSTEAVVKAVQRQYQQQQDHLGDCTLVAVLPVVPQGALSVTAVGVRRRRSG